MQTGVNSSVLCTLPSPDTITIELHISPNPIPMGLDYLYMLFLLNYLLVLFLLNSLLVLRFLLNPLQNVLHQHVS